MQYTNTDGNPITYQVIPQTGGNNPNMEGAAAMPSHTAGTQLMNYPLMGGDMTVQEWVDSSMNPVQRPGTGPLQMDERALQEALTDLIGRFIVVEFLIGTGQMATRAGILADVGRSYLVLLDPCNGSQTLCDLYAMKFVTVFLEEQLSLQTVCAGGLNIKR